MNDPCLSTILTRQVPVAAPFVKGGVPDADFDVPWYLDPVLRLPVGTWRIRAPSKSEPSPSLVPT